VAKAILVANGHETSTALLLPAKAVCRQAVPGATRHFFDNRFVYCVLSQRARGLSIGVNLNPDGRCNFDCVYCEVCRGRSRRDKEIVMDVMVGELEKMLRLAHDNRMDRLPPFERTPRDFLQLEEVALSGDGEPTLCPNFIDVVQAVVHVRAQGELPFFKIVLITNCTGFDRAPVQSGMQLLTSRDEIWAKLDAGTQACMDRVNRPGISLERLLKNILLVARQRPVVIQSLFPLIDGEEPSAGEIEEYVQRLRELKEAGAQISLVQVYSAHRPAAHGGVRHLPLRTLSLIARRVRDATGLRAEVF
jgi:wyosine [tRNA(Phe)-imidazoG37] synthetase (radical SAM superfamily)